MNEIAPTSDKQVSFAQRIADSLGCEVPVECLNDKVGLSTWIDENLKALPKDSGGHAVFKPSLKQVGFAEKVANDAGKEIPADCYFNAAEMSKFIDDNISCLKNKPTDKMIDLARKIKEFNPSAPDPSKCLEDHDLLRNWLDANFPEEWRNSSGEKRPATRKKRPSSMEDLL